MDNNFSVAFFKIQKKFGDTSALKEISFQIKKGEFIVFVGPSGCGKTTTLRLIAGLEDVSSGEIFSNGKDITWEFAKNRKVSMVFQTYALYPHLSVYENIKYPLDILKVPKVQKHQLILQMAEKLEIESLLKKKPSELSGGQKQRVAIGRALIRKPEILLLDEPLSNLDARLRETMRSYIRQLHDTLKKTTIYVTHDQTEAMTLADRIFVFSKGEIMQIGSPQEVYKNPKNLFVARFIGSPPINYLQGEFTNNQLIGEHGKLKLAKIKKNTSLPKEFTIAFRPQDIFITDSGELEAKFLYSEYLGAEYHYKFKCKKKKILVVSPKELALKKNSNYKIQLDYKKAFFFDNKGDRVCF